MARTLHQFLNEDNVKAIAKKLGGNDEGVSHLVSHGDYHVFSHGDEGIAYHNHRTGKTHHVTVDPDYFEHDGPTGKDLKDMADDQGHKIPLDVHKKVAKKYYS